MQWFALGSVFLYVTGCVDAGALKCVFGTQDSSCLTEKREISPVQDAISADCQPGSNCLPRYKREPETPCVPGSSFKIDCNSCHCNALGQAACTKKGCIKDFKRAVEKRDTSNTYNTHSLMKRAVCKSSQDFSIECNQCKCAANGLSYTCTQNECLDGEATTTTPETLDMDKEVEVFMESGGADHIERHSVCKPLDTFYVNCNTCHCNDDGTDYSCTNKPCPLPEDVEVFHELKEAPTKPTSSPKVVCVANRMFIKDCNTCWCNEDGTSFFCTRRVCIDQPGEETGDPTEELKLREFKEECTPNEIFEMDCNMCRCNPDGKSYSCTRRACVDIDEKNTTLRRSRAAPEVAKTCQPGQEFRMDCNKCLCNDEGQDFSCTRIDCAAVNNNGGSADSFAGTRTKREAKTHEIELDCVPGSVFDRDCNVCRCTTDGHHASCTQRRCSRVADKDASTTTESSPSFRCTPGDQFKRDCNDCTCSADGKNVFCTLRLCDQDLALADI